MFILDGTTEYTLNCQHTPEWAEEIERGCEQIVRTFSVETESTVPPAAETSPPAQAEETTPTEAEEIDVLDLKVGDCLAEIQATEQIFSVPVVPCSEPHSEEIYAAVTLPEGTSPARRPWMRRQTSCAPRSSRASSGCLMRNRLFSWLSDTG